MPVTVTVTRTAAVPPPGSVTGVVASQWQLLTGPCQVAAVRVPAGQGSVAMPGPGFKPVSKLWLEDVCGLRDSQSESLRLYQPASQRPCPAGRRRRMRFKLWRYYGRRAILNL